MISETRRLVFTADAIVDAMLLWLQSTRRSDLLAGYVKSGQVRTKPDLHLVMIIQSKDLSETKEVRFNADQIGAALISYCVRQKIPLPKQAVKSLERHGDNLSLIIQRRVDRTPLHHLT